ncbi:MAG: hypothetical protein ABI950_06985 [Solirubrobacteraceae bacterium]
MDLAPPSTSGTLHVKSRDFEVKDTQWLSALLAKSFPDIDPDAVAVTGGSYGGGESWVQASQPTWDFPNSQDPSLPVLKLQVAVPKYLWTDLSYALAPSVHGDPYSTSQGHPDSDTGNGYPTGVPKASYISGLFASGTANGKFEDENTNPAVEHQTQPEPGEGGDGRGESHRAGVPAPHAPIAYGTPRRPIRCAAWKPTPPRTRPAASPRPTASSR